MLGSNKVSLSEICDLIPGFAFKSRDFTNTCDKVIKIADIQPPYVFHKDLKSVNISGYKKEKLAKFIAKSGDLVLAMTGATIGKLGRLQRGHAYVNQRVLLLKPKENIDKDYFYYSLLGVNFQKFILNHIDSQTAQPNISATTIGKYTIPIPSLEEQKRIGKILRSLDRKIELNLEINDNLLQQTKELFDYYYARAENKIGFTELIQVASGGTPKTTIDSYWNGEIPFFTPKDVGLPYTVLTEKKITQEGLAHCNSSLYPVNTVFITARGTVGKVSLSGVPMAMNQSCYALISKQMHPLLVYFSALKVVHKLKNKANGAVFDAITTRDFQVEQISLLSPSDSCEFLKIAEPIFQNILNNTIENQCISKLRDTVLPKLFSGEINIP